MSQYFEQGNVYNAMNFQVNIYTPQNTTVSALGQSTLWCPSDSVITNLQFTYPAGTSHRHAADRLLLVVRRLHGPVVPVVRPDRSSAAAAAACQFGTAYPDTQTNGLIYMLSAVSMASVTDGTSNTILSGERAHGKFPAVGYLLLELVDLGQLR